METNYTFLKEFCDHAELSLSTNGELPYSTVVVFSPVKVKKGTKNNPSPFYDREMVTENDNDRYTLYQLKKYSFKFGDKYESDKEQELNETEKTDKAVTRIKPDDSCRILYQNLKTGVLTVDVINPIKVGETVYFIKSTDPITGTTFNKVDSNSDVMGSINEWKPSHNGEFKQIVYQQFSLGNVVYLLLDEDHSEYINPVFLDNNLVEQFKNLY